MESVYVVLFWMLVATAGVFVFSMISFTRIQKTRHYQCPHCGHRFKPGGLTAYFSKRENVTDRLLFCPRCGYRNFMENIDDAALKDETQNNGNEGSGNPD